MRRDSYTIWLTGLSGSGKTTIGLALQEYLQQLGINTCLLDGDVLRTGLCRDLGFSDSDRSENIRRAIEVAKITQNAGLVNICCFISPFDKERKLARETLSPNFIEVFVDCPIEVCQQRDPKGLYLKVQLGILKNFTGIDSPYEKPDNSEIILHTNSVNTTQCVDRIIRYLRTAGLLQC